MKNKLDVIILGSCVSRDCFRDNIDSYSKFKLVDYYARSSFSSLGSNPTVHDINLELIESKFQRRCVRRDLDKSIMIDIKKNNFDVILIDFIDERLSLFSTGEDSYITRSTELLRSDVNKKGKYKIIPAFSDRHFELFKKGLYKFLSVCKKNNMTHKIRISKLLWADCPSMDKADIHKANNYLNKLYQCAELLLPKTCFIYYPESIFASDPNHVWGRSPFHYTSNLYEYTLKALSDSI